MRDRTDDHPAPTAPRDVRPCGGPGAPVRHAASAVLFRGRTVLLVERGTGAARGLWSLPGGHLEDGESAADGCLRELAEETGIAAVTERLIGVHETVAATTPGAAPTRYRISVFLCRETAHDGFAAETAVPAPPKAASDARNARFVDIDALEELPLTDGAAQLIGRALSGEVAGGDTT